MSGVLSIDASENPVTLFKAFSNYWAEGITIKIYHKNKIVIIFFFYVPLIYDTFML